MFSKMTLLLTLITSIPSISGFFIEIPEGEVGVNYQRGVLQPEILNPGWHVYLPFYTRIETIDIRYQTDEFKHISCGSSDGNSLMFEEIKVVNHLKKEYVVDVITRYGIDYDRKLIYDVIEQNIREICSTMTLDEIYRTKFSTIDEKLKDELVGFQKYESSNLLIKKINVKKPLIDPKIKNNYDDTTEEKTRQQKEMEIQKRKLIEEETKKVIREQEALREKSVSQIDSLRKIELEETAARLQKIKTESEASKKKTETESQAYTINTLAEANSKKFTREYLQWHWQENVLKNADAFYGNELPKFVLQQSPADIKNTITNTDK